MTLSFLRIVLSSLAFLIAAPLASSETTQAILSSAREMNLVSIQYEQFAVLTHPIFPGRSVRIKKSKFCDGEVL